MAVKLTVQLLSREASETSLPILYQTMELYSCLINGINLEEMKKPSDWPQKQTDNYSDENRNQNSSSCDSGVDSIAGRKVNNWEDSTNNVNGVQPDMKSLVNTEDGSDLSQLSPVLTCIRTLNGSGFILEEERTKCVKSLCLSKLKNEVEISRKDGFLFAVSLRDGACLFTSAAITDHLGYPKDMLMGQSFINFMYDKDHLTFANHLTQGLNVCFTQGKRDDSHLVLNTFFCRMRVYQGLKFGYSVGSKPQYKPFKIILHINELVLDDICVEKPLATLCVKATATQVSSAYSVPKEIPAMTSFSTRHTASCHFSHVDASAIPYLGFLPQDMVGYSVFDFYHIDDMPQLKEIYELVIKEHGTSFRSKPYRFKVHNGCYIMLETEWSCFINPWSHKLEFVVGQHRVLKGPSDINIFTPCEISETNASDEIIKESQAIQKEIKVILSQSLENFQFKKNKRLCNKRKRDLVSFVYSCIDKANVNGDKFEVMEERGSHTDPDSVVMGDISPFREMNDSSVSSPPTVQQMRYQENIERFFASQPKTYSDGSDDFKNDKSSSVEEYQGSSSGSGNGSGSGNVSGNASKENQSASPNYDRKIQESGSNSSKGNMSSSITGDSGYGKSWAKEGTNDLDSSQAGPSKSKSSRMKNSCDSNEDNITFASCFALTEETLSAHNKISQKQIKQQRKNTSHKTAIPIKENRVQQNDVGHSKNKKNNRNHNLTSQTNTPTTATVHTGYRCAAPNPDRSNQDNFSTSITNANNSCLLSHNTCPGSGPIPTPFFVPVVYMGSVPCFPPAVNPFWSYTPTPNSENQNLPFNPVINFPLTPGFPFPTMPTYVENLNCNHHTVRSSGVTTTSHHSTTTTTVASETSTTFKNTVAGKEYSAYKKENTKMAKAAQNHKQDSEGIESDMQIDESLSSFTKSSSQQSQDKDEDMDFDVKKFYAASSSDKIELNSEIAFRYQMNTSNVDEVLKKDREMLKSMQQPDLVNKQLQMLQKEIKDENESKPKIEDGFCITEDIMLGLTTEEAVTENSSSDPRKSIQK
nr:period circadian protein isoform X3 [Parasteatoda tepidariorum]XP_042895415.1 period circadian protein isoform X3 [Parasteatoda tepidariorum]